MNSLLRVQKVDFSTSSKSILSNIDLTLERGQILSILGPNGGGKTTLLKLIAGLIPTETKDEQSGVWICDERIDLLSPSKRSRAVFYLDSDLYTEFPLRVKEVLRLTRETNVSAIARVLVSTQMQGFEDRWIHTLSGGERQRVAIALAMIQDPEVLLLDESFSKMDLDHQCLMHGLLRKWVSQKSKSLILVSHDVRFAASFSDQIAWMSRGKIAGVGAPSEMMTEAWISKIYPGIDQSVL